jgi:3-deoxy-D-manno-octulosonic-acid transferase
MALLWFYSQIMTLGKPIIMGALKNRINRGKEDPDHIQERYGMASRLRPDGELLWVHVASVGEAQSLLPLIDLYLKQNCDSSVLVTSITTTSAELLSKRLPPRAFHQYLPVDRPKWVKRFLEYWQPTLVFWAESELWPIMISEIGKRRLPMALINARLSEKSYRNWSYVRKYAEDILSAFTVILTQTESDKKFYQSLGARSVVTVGNIKFAASDLPINSNDYQVLQEKIINRPVWVYASTHAGEEELAVATHLKLKEIHPNLLTIIIPRHPDRRETIVNKISSDGLVITSRTNLKVLPKVETDIYLVDTLGELGLFYKLCPIAMIGRSFSEDGGGGHNPLEALRLGSVVLHGPNTQNLQDIYSQLHHCGVAQLIQNPDDLATTILHLLNNPNDMNNLKDRGLSFINNHNDVLKKLIEELEPVFLLAEHPVLTT